MKQVQFGNILEIPRTDGLTAVVTRAMQFAVEDFLGFAHSMGLDPLVASQAVSFYYVSPTGGPGSNHADPLRQAPESRGVRLHESHVVGWKIAIWVEGDVRVDDLDHVLVEGMAVGRTR